MFAIMHQRFNALFEFMKSKKKGNGHFNASESRELLNLIKLYEDMQYVLRETPLAFRLDDTYDSMLKFCKGFLKESNGSEIPDDLPEFKIKEYEPIFSISQIISVPIVNKSHNYELKFIGEGSYAKVFKYKDTFYNKFYILKRAKDDLDAKELSRFRLEFDTMRELKSPYVLEAVSYTHLDVYKRQAGKKVQKARAKLPKTREYTLQRVFDEKTGKGKYVVVPLDKEKPFRQEGIPKTTMRRMRNESRNFVHGKIAETEKENSAVEGAHKSEQKGEELFSFVKRQIKGKGQKQRAKVAKLEKKQFKKEVNFQYQKFLEENPQMQKKTLQKRLQKQRIKREYMKARKKAAASKAAEQAFEKTKNGAVTVARKLQAVSYTHLGWNSGKWPKTLRKNG